MKYLTVVWAILILALACFPCMDSGISVAQGFATTVQADDLHQDGAQDDDLCTPLCDCNCCGGVKVAFQVTLLPEPLDLQHNAFLSTYLEQGAATPSFPFWHPPRV